MKKILISTFVSVLMISCTVTHKSDNVNLPAQIFNGITAGSSMPGITKTGVDLSEESSSTAPLLSVVTDGPNKGCFVSSHMYADMKANRIYGKLQNLSCVLKDQRIVDKPINGYVVGNDGKAGMVPIIGYNKSGQKLFSINAASKLTIVFTDSVTN